LTCWNKQQPAAAEVDNDNPKPFITIEMNAKRYIIILTELALLLSLNKAYAQVSYPWYVQTDIAKASGATNDTLLYGLTPQNRQTTRVFMDGLGRSIQSMALQASPQGNDVVQPIVYDNLGRQTVSYLGYAGKSTDTMGQYRSNALTAQAAFYNQTTQYLIAVDTAAHARQVFETSPLQRLLETGMAGAGYQPGDAGTQHYKTVSYRPNKFTADSNIYITGTTGVISTSAVYADDALWVTDAIDEDGHEGLVFKDLAGRVIMKRQKTGITADPNYDTYYVYNFAGMLAYILPPKAVSLLKAHPTYNLATAQVANLIYSYAYNNLGLLYAKTVPNKGTTFIIYDPQNRPLLMRDSAMYAKHQWHYFKYDARGRVISTGIYTNASYPTYSAMLGYVATAYGTTYWYEIRTVTASAHYYTNQVFPTAGLTPLTYNYYDGYTYPGSHYKYGYVKQTLPNEETATADSLEGVPTMTLRYTLGPGIATPIWLMTATFYDKYGHVIQTRSNNQLDYTTDTLTDTKTIVPDFTGKPLVTKALVKSGSGTTYTNSVTSTFNYDYFNMRLFSIDQVYNSQASKRIASYIYNEAGQLILKKLDSVGGNWLQNEDFRYNIRGQLTTINNSQLNGDGGKTNNDSNDLFGMQIMYDQPDANIGAVTPSYSGMISAVKWMTRNSSSVKTNERSYAYTYDKLGRDTSAYYAERDTGSTSTFNVNNHGFDENGIRYDENGNIINLKRTTSSGVGATSYTVADNLTYGYDGTMPNKLNTVTDAGSSTLGFITPNGTTGSYGYDVNGNLISDPYKGLTLKYNYMLNLADSIMQTSTIYLSYTYDADGNVLRKQQYTSGTMTTQTDYINGFVYITSGGVPTLSYITNAEGRVVNNSGTLTQEYIFTDQQGNARFSFQESSGAILAKQENSYYPLGETYTSSTLSPPTVPNKKLVNGGSEWQNDMSNMPDYQQTTFRNYDAEIGRFIAVDPDPESAEDMSVYQYAGNNPISNNDPTGGKAAGGGYGSEAGTNNAFNGFGPIAAQESGYSWSNNHYYGVSALFGGDGMEGAENLFIESGGGGFRSTDEIIDALTDLYNSKYGGYATSANNVNAYTSESSALYAGIQLYEAQGGTRSESQILSDYSAPYLTAAMSFSSGHPAADAGLQSGTLTPENGIYNYLTAIMMIPFTSVQNGYEGYPSMRVAIGFSDPGDLGYMGYQWIQTYSRNNGPEILDHLPEASFPFYYSSQDVSLYSGSYFSSTTGESYFYDSYLFDAPGFRPDRSGSFSAQSTLVGSNVNGTIEAIESTNYGMSYRMWSNSVSPWSAQTNASTSNYTNLMIFIYNNSVFLSGKP
jgi:RHS repeat-associated protein